MKPSQLARRRAQHIILFGDPKTGKSTMVAKLLMEGFRITWISMDNGHEVIFKLPIPAEKLDEQLNIIVLPDTKEFPVAIGTCLKIVGGQPVNICDKHGVAECAKCRQDKLDFTRVCTSDFEQQDILVFDHIGQLANSAMAFIMNKGKKTDDDKPEWDDYFKQGTLMDRFLTNIQQAKYNVICITHTTETEMEDGKKRLVPLVGSASFSRNAGKYFDHVVHCDVVNGSHKFGSSTTYRASMITGSRSDVAIEKMKEASLKEFFDGTILPPEEAGSMAAVKVLEENKKQSVTIDAEALVEEVAATPAITTTHTSTAADMLAKLKMGKR